MAALRIPDPHRTTLRWWFQLDDDTSATIADVIDACPPYGRRDRIAEHVATQTGLDRSQIEDLLDVFLSMIRTERTQAAWHGTHASRAEFARDVYKSAVVSDDANVSDGLPNAQIDRTVTVLGSESLQIASKAFFIQSDNHRTYGVARITSDLRTVFADDPSKPLGSVVVHHLKLEHLNGGEDHFVALDHLDLLKLRDVIDRAVTKDAALRQIARSAGLTDLELEDSDGQIDYSGEVRSMMEE